MNKDLVVSKSVKIKADKAAVWDALIDPEKIKLYFFGTEVESLWKVGDPIIFRGAFDGKSFEDKGNIIEIREEQILQYDYWSSWSGLEDKAENYSLVTYTLKEAGGQTMLSMTQKGFASEMNLEHAISSWDYVLEEIKSILEANS